MRRPTVGLLVLTLLLVMNPVCEAETRDRDEYDLSWFTIDGGGGQSTAGDYTLVGTVGQLDTAGSGGGSYWLEGGFWSLPGSDFIFGDGFESGGTSQWSAASTLPVFPVPQQSLHLIIGS